MCAFLSWGIGRGEDIKSSALGATKEGLTENISEAAGVLTSKSLTNHTAGGYFLSGMTPHHTSP